MKSIYALLAFSAFVVAFWYVLAGFMVYQIVKDFAIWHTLWGYIDWWIKWRYGLGQ